MKPNLNYIKEKIEETTTPQTCKIDYYKLNRYKKMTLIANSI